LGVHITDIAADNWVDLKGLKKIFRTDQGLNASFGVSMA